MTSQNTENHTAQNQSSQSQDTIIRTLINADYTSTHEAMLEKTLYRIEQKRQGIITPDELWIVEHNDVYTLGQAGKEEHILQRGNTPVIQTDRGGQVTWHGKGQLVLYWLIDLNNAGWSVRDLVSHAEQSIEDVVNNTLMGDSGQATTNTPNANDFYAKSRRDAPGVYIYNRDELMLGKIASLGFKIKHGFSYHGIALNLTCDLSVFNAINPCGYAGMQMLKLADFVALDQVDKDSLPTGFNPIEDSIAQLDVTHQLISNILQRKAKQIDLRLSQDKL